MGGVMPAELAVPGAGLAPVGPRALPPAEDSFMSQGSNADAKEKEKSFARFRKMRRQSNRESTSSIMLQGSRAVELVAAERRGKVLTRREVWFVLLTEPGASPLARRIATFLWFVLLAYAVARILESVEGVTDMTGPWPWIISQWVFNVIFTLEALLRLVVTPLSEARRDLFLLNDVLTSVPFWVRLAVYPNSLFSSYLLSGPELAVWMRTLEAIVTLRVFKLCRYYDGAFLLYLAVRSSVAQLTVPLFMLSLLMFVFAAILREIEYDANIDRCAQLWRSVQGISTTFLAGHPGGVTWDCSACTNVPNELPCAQSALNGQGCSTERQMCDTCNGHPDGHPECVEVAFAQIFPDMLTAMWFMLVTATTVGYGDYYPTSVVGRFFVMFVIMCGVIFLAMPIAIVGRTFTTTWDEREKRRLAAAARQLLAAHGLTRQDIADQLAEMVEEQDDGGGRLRLRTLMRFFDNVVPGRLADGDILKLYRSASSDGNGVVHLADFLDVLFPDKKGSGLTVRSRASSASSAPTAEDAGNGRRRVRRASFKMRRGSNGFMTPPGLGGAANANPLNAFGGSSANQRMKQLEAKMEEMQLQISAQMSVVQSDLKAEVLAAMCRMECKLAEIKTIQCEQAVKQARPKSKEILSDPPARPKVFGIF